MGQMRNLDIAIDELGLLRLCTTPPTIRLLGNQIDEQSASELRAYGVDVAGVQETKVVIGWKKKFFRLPLIQKIVYFFYERLFRIINA